MCVATAEHGWSGHQRYSGLLRRQCRNSGRKSPDGVNDHGRSGDDWWWLRRQRAVPCVRASRRYSIRIAPFVCVCVVFGIGARRDNRVGDAATTNVDADNPTSFLLIVTDMAILGSDSKKRRTIIVWCAISKLSVVECRMGTAGRDHNLRQARSALIIHDRPWTGPNALISAASRSRDGEPHFRWNWRGNSERTWFENLS